MASLLTATVSLSAMMLAGADAAYVHEVETWRQNYEAGLKAPSGWLAVAGLAWLHEGENSMGTDPNSEIVLPAGAPLHAAPLVRKGDQVTYEGRSLKPDSSDHPDVLKFGTAEITVIKRGERLGARLRDPNAATRRNFTGSKWYPIDRKWRVEARWVPDPKKIPIVNILGMKEEQPSPGYVEFVFEGKKIRLDPVVEDNQLFFIFKDQTSGRTTYGAGRYLYSAMPKDGKVVLEFNEAKNPPCAFIAFATCPLPPRQNVMPVALEAGEKKYGNH